MSRQKPTPEQVRAEIAVLADLPSLEYSRERKAAAQRLGMGVADLDKVVKGARARQRAEHAATARRAASPRCGEVRWPPGYLMKPDGLYADQGKQGLVWLCARFNILGEARDHDGGAWSLWLKWEDRDGRPHTWAMPTRLLMVGPGEMEAELVDRGLRVSPDPAARMLLRRALGEVQAGTRVLLISRAGWHALPSGGHAYVFPDGAVEGTAVEALVLQRPAENARQMSAQAGTLAGWQTEVAALAAGNDVATFAISAAFAGPLLEPAGESSGGFHFAGRSKTGKTAAARLAASVHGLPFKGGTIRDWRTTTNGMEGAAEETSDGLLIADELHQAEPKGFLSAIYMIANEAGKGRMRRDTSAAKRKTWRLFLLSTGEMEVSAFVARAGDKMPAGADVRLPSLQMDPAGIWPALHGRVSMEALMSDLHAALRRQHGTPIRAFVARLVAERADDQDGVAAFVDTFRDRFAKELPKDADPQAHDVARRFALVAAAGEMARSFGVVPWVEGTAEGAAKRLMQSWRARRGGVGSLEEQAQLRAIRLFLVEHGASRFVALHQEQKGWVETHPDRPVVRRAGWRRRLTDGRFQHLIEPEVWRELCAEAGVDATETARTLLRLNLMKSGDGKNVTCSVRVPGVGKTRAYVVSEDMLGDAES